MPTDEMRPEGLLLGPGPSGAWDDQRVSGPRGLREANGTWRMYYHGLDPERLVFVIGLAESGDGLTWTKRGPIVGPGEPGAFDALGVGTRHVIHHHGRYWMLYEGVGQDGHHSIGLATSEDAVNWTRRPGPENDGSVFAHAPWGSGRWDAFAVGTPCVVPMPEGSFRLYYAGANETASGYADELALSHRIGLALSDGPDLTRWARW